MYASTISFSLAIRRFPSVLHLQQEHWHIDCMPHLVCSRAVENVTNKPVTMGGHCDKIDIFLAGQLNDLIRRFTKCEYSSAGEALCANSLLRLSRYARSCFISSLSASWS